MTVEELAPGLWRWTAPHPAWQEGEDWPRDVGCLYFEAPEETVLVDPLVPENDAGRFFAALDRDVERLGRPVAVVLTAPWHKRSAGTIVERYGGRVWPGEGDAPAGIEPYAVPPVEEGQIALFLRERGALVTAEVLAGVDGLTVWPSPNLRDARELDAFLRGLLDLPIRMILPSHGEPVLEDAHAALEQTLGSWSHSPPSAE